jgi:hypothetical protein
MHASCATTKYLGEEKADLLGVAVLVAAVKLNGIHRRLFFSWWLFVL